MHYLKALLFNVFMLASLAVSAQVDINSADAAALADAIDGVGEKKARTIVEYRRSNGPFASIDELSAIKGIGPATVERNRHNLRADPPR